MITLNQNRDILLKVGNPCPDTRQRGGSRMTDPRISNLARILVNYSTKVQPDQQVAIISQPIAEPLIREVYREVIRVGGYPYVLPNTTPTFVPGTPGVAEILFTEGNENQLKHIDPFIKMVNEEFDVRIIILSRINTKGWSQIDPQNLGIRSKAHTPVIDIYRKRSAAGEMDWVVVLFPTHAYAQDAEMSLQEFEDYVFSTTYADTEDPVAEWQQFHDFQQGLIERLSGSKELQVKGPNIDLTLSIEGRPFINADGTKNMPSGEIYTSPVEDSANGWVRFTYPAVYRGREVSGVELRFEGGRAVKATAEKNEDFLLGMLDMDEGSRYVGEFAIGTNKKINRFIKNILFDEKIGGTIHMAMGFGFLEAGSKNKSALHWDMICDMRDGGQIFVDGDLFYESGEFKT
jgi:aminopeptidase